MKKFLVAMAAVLAMSVTVSAQDTKTEKACPAGAKCEKQEACKGENKKCDQALCPFEGLNLTEAQQAQIKELRANCQQQKKEGKEQKKATRKECKQNMLAQLKTILTPEQYIQFLENSFVNGNGQKGKAAKQGQRGGKKAEQHGHRSAVKKVEAQQ